MIHRRRVGPGRYSFYTRRGIARSTKQIQGLRHKIVFLNIDSPYATVPGEQYYGVLPTDASRRYRAVRSRMRAVYLGPKASFSHQAAVEIFKSSEVQVEALPTFADIFEGVQSSRFEYGVIPFENSSNGSVVQSLDLLADRGLEYRDVRVCAEFCLPVRHQLLVSQQCVPDDHGTSRQELLNDTLKGIEKFYTHPQVWGQCSMFLSRSDCRSIARQDCSSTSEAARVVSETALGARYAAIASELAAAEYGLLTLAENIEDKGDNATRFFVVARAETPFLQDRQQPSPGNEHEKGVQNAKLYKNLVSFTIDHKSPGALAMALSIFKLYDLNLTSINTRPSRLRPWHYIFFAECEQVCEKKHGCEAIDALVADLNRGSMSCRHLGTWEDRLR